MGEKQSRNTEFLKKIGTKNSPLSGAAGFRETREKAILEYDQRDPGDETGWDSQEDREVLESVKPNEWKPPPPGTTFSVAADSEVSYVEEMKQPFPDMHRHPLSQKFHNKLVAAGEEHDKKQKDYGNKTDPFANVRSSEEFGIPGWVGALVRGNDKMTRLQNAAKRGSLAVGKVEEDMLELAVYALIALVMYEEESAREDDLM